MQKMYINQFFLLVGCRASRRAVCISLFLVFLPQFTGAYVLQSYTTAFFTEAGSTLTPIESSIMICIVQLVANLVTMFLIDRIGRKFLFVMSSIGTGIGMFVLALHHLFKNELPECNWLPIYGLSFTIFSASIGLIPVSYVITIDVLPPRVSSNCEMSWMATKREIFLFKLFFYIFRSEPLQWRCVRWLCGHLDFAWISDIYTYSRWFKYMVAY